MANFRKLRHNESFTNRKAHEFWAKFFEQGTALFNPLPYAFEGNARRIPEFGEFVQAFEQGVKDVAETFPLSRVVRYSPAHYQQAYAQLFRPMHANTFREIEFLCEISSLLAMPTSPAKLRSAADCILKAAEKHSVDRQSLAVLIALIWTPPDGKGFAV